MRAFLKAGIDPNGYIHGLRMLSKAVYCGGVDVALVLLEYGANPSLSDRDIAWYGLCTPLGHAIYEKSIDLYQPWDLIVFPLMRAGAKITRVAEFDNLISLSDCFTALKFAVEHGSDLSDLVSDDGGSCRLQLLSLLNRVYITTEDTWIDQLKILQWFITQYPELLNVLGPDQNSALTVTLEIGVWSDTVRLLLKHGIELGVRNIYTGLDELETARRQWPEMMPFIERRLELDRQRQDEVIDGLLPPDLVPWD